jgi:hypothetical protein
VIQILQHSELRFNPHGRHVRAVAYLHGVLVKQRRKRMRTEGSILYHSILSFCLSTLKRVLPLLIKRKTWRINKIRTSRGVNEKNIYIIK